MKWVRSKQVLWRVAPDYLVLGGLDGTTVEIAGPAGDVWQRLGEPIEFNLLVGQLAEMYDAEPKRVASDVERLLRELEIAGYVDRFQ